MKETIEIKQEKNLSFEDSLKRVEDIALILEDGDLPLQKRVEKFEEGIKLIKQCENELKKVELIIKKVIDKNESVDENESPELQDLKDIQIVKFITRE